MILRIAVHDLQVGMYIDSIECSWLQNPFWRGSLLVREAGDIARLKRSAVEFVSIDTDRGRGVMPIPVAVSELAPESTVLLTNETALPPPARRRRSVSSVESLEAMLERSKQKVLALFEEARLGQGIQVAAVGPLVDDIALRIRRDAVAMVAGTRRKAGDDYTYLHSIAVCALMIQFAIHLGFDEERVRAFGAAGLLHDIGKATTPAGILHKPGVLDADELVVMRRHAAAGHVLLRDLGETDAVTLDVCRHHHERINGQGYPDGLAGDAISLHARIAAICDVYDAVTSVRPYKRAWSPNEALSRMRSWEGHFDPELLDAFITMLGIAPLGELVRLRSNRLGIVVGGSDDPLRPLVRTFFDIPLASFVEPDDVDTAADAVVRRERGPYWFGDGWPSVAACIWEDRRLDPEAMAVLRSSLQRLTGASPMTTSARST